MPVLQNRRAAAGWPMGWRILLASRPDAYRLRRVRLRSSPHADASGGPPEGVDGVIETEIVIAGEMDHVRSDRG